MTQQTLHFPDFSRGSRNPNSHFRPCEQFKRVEAVMGSGTWMTLGEIARETLARFSKYDSEAGISARIRQFTFMGLSYDKRVRQGYEKLYEYRMTA